MTYEKSFKYWENRQAIAKNKKTEGKKVLIEIAAQHPLKNGREPGAEFESRLLRAIELYEREREKGNDVIFYIPGSVHYIVKDGEKIVDEVALADAGKDFLIKKGISPEIIRANDANEKYTEGKGVYNSGDECDVSSRIYKDEGCGRLISVVSPVQVFRKAMFYHEFGVQPEIHSVPLDKTYHNYVGEMFWSLYITTFIDHSWQGEKSFLSVLTRKERNDNYIPNEVEQDTLENGRIVIPKAITTVREGLMEKYNKAKENMQGNTKSEKTLIQISLSKNSEKEIAEALELCEKQQTEGKKVTVILNNIEDAKRFYSRLHESGLQKENIDIKFGSNIQGEFFEGKYGSLYCVCQADKTMKVAFDSINKGIIPLIVSVPNKDDDYIKQTFDLFNKVIGRGLINLTDKPGVEIQTRADVIRGLLMNEIDVENLPDVDSWEWSSNMTEGEDLYTIEER